MCNAAAGEGNLMDGASGVLVPDKQSKGESGGERMGSTRDAAQGNRFVLTEQEEWRDGWSLHGEVERGGEREGGVGGEGKEEKERIAMCPSKRAHV